MCLVRATVARGPERSGSVWSSERIVDWSILAAAVRRTGSIEPVGFDAARTPTGTGGTDVKYMVLFTRADWEDGALRTSGSSGTPKSASGGVGGSAGRG